MTRESGQYVLPLYEDEINGARSELKRKFLEPFFTNLDKDIYAITGNLPPVLAAALIARQSRAGTHDARELLWQEFVNSSELGLAAIGGNTETEKLLASDKARKMIRRIIDGYGDDSVREQASAYVMLGDCSILATTLGITHPLLTRVEASTRYINWGQKENGKYRYKELDFGTDAQAKEAYESVMEVCFETYGELWQPVWDYVTTNNPKGDGVSDEAYLSSIRGRVCDNLRGLLPMAALTNFGLHGDFRSLSELIMNLRASDNEEMRLMGDCMAQELSKVNPEFVSVVDSKHGLDWTRHKREQTKYLDQILPSVESDREMNRKPGIELSVSTRHFAYTIARAYLTSQGLGVDNGDLHRLAEEMVNTGRVDQILVNIGQMRTNRRHELPDFFRSVILKIKFGQISLGSLKDLFRHRRILWRSRPDLSGQNGFHVPKDIAAMGGEILEKYGQAQLAAVDVVDRMRRHGNEQASQYMLTHGMLTSFVIDCDLVEGYWISELRSIASGFEEYRWFAQELWRVMSNRLPSIKVLGSFTDTNDYSLGRIKEAVRADLRGRKL